VIHINTALFHDFYQIPVGNPIADTEENGEHNHVLRELAAFETDQRYTPGKI
jgi:hypothetical protein